MSVKLDVPKLSKKRSRELITDIDIDFDMKLKIGEAPDINNSRLPPNFITEYYQNQKQIANKFIDRDLQIIEMQNRIQALEKEVAELKFRTKTSSGTKTSAKECNCKTVNEDGYYWKSVLN